MSDTKLPHQQQRSISSLPQQAIHPHFTATTDNFIKPPIHKIISDSSCITATSVSSDNLSPTAPLRVTTDDDGTQRYLSTSKMSSKGPVSEEFTLKGSTPSGKPRLFVCSICTRAFARQEHLKRHERSHTKEKPFTCNICQRKFSRRDLLLRHSTKLHAGAADVIPRLRKKSLKHSRKESTATTSTINKEPNSLISSNKRTSTVSANSVATTVSSAEPFLPPIKKEKTSTASNQKSNSRPRGIAKSKNSLSINTELNSNSLLFSSDDVNSNHPLGQMNLPFYQLSDPAVDPLAEYSDISSSAVALFPEDYRPSQAPNANNYRRASFSAMSGVNYALTNPQPYATETVEFSTPQFTSMDDDAQEKWLNSLSDNMSPNFANPPSYQTEIQQLSNLINKTHQNNQSQNPQLSSAVTNGYSFYDDDTNGITESLFKTRLESLCKAKANNGAIRSRESPKPFKSTSPILQNEALNVCENKKENSATSIKVNLLDKLNLEQIEKLTRQSQINANQNTGNSRNNFYESLFEHDAHPNNSPSNNKKNNDSLDGVTKKVLSWQETLFNQPIFDLERLNEMNISNTYNIPQGYSFYDVSNVNSASADSLSSNDRGITNANGNKSQGILGSYNNRVLISEATISPVLLEANLCHDNDIGAGEMDVDENPNSAENKADILNKQEDHKQNNVNAHHLHHEHHKKSFEEEFNDSRLKSYSQIYLFTQNIDKLIRHALLEYPFFGTPTPELLSNDSLNYYVDQFVAKFLTHYPFIHRTFLNEHYLIKESIDSILKYTVSTEDSLNYDSDEIKIVRDEKFTENFKVSIVCLPLLISTIGAVVSNKKEDASVLYEISRRCIHVYLESRKKLKTVGGVKGTNNQEFDENINTSPLWLIQSLTLSIIYGLFADEEISLSVIIRQVHALNALIKSSKINEIIKFIDIKQNFKNFIKYESTIRTIHMIFHISTLLSTLYNIVPSLTINDLIIDLPNTTLLWECYNEEEYHKLIENFDFDAQNIKEVLQDLINLDLSCIDTKTGLVNNRNFLLDHHVSEFGLNCLQNCLHQIVYFKQTYLANGNVNYTYNDVREIETDDLIIDDFENLISDNSNNLRLLEKIRKIGEYWNLIVKSCVLYNDSSEVFNDCKILNHHLNLKLNSIMSLSKIKENVWLKSFNEINEQYFASFNYNEDELKNSNFQNELIFLIENSIDILKLVFFNEDNSLIGKISPTFELKNEAIKKLDSIYTEFNDNELNKINLNVLHKLSIDSQILFDVILIIVKFLINYENFFKMRMKFNSLTNYTFLQHFELSSTIFGSSINNSIKNEGFELQNPEEALNQFDKSLFKYYIKFFKIFLNLEQFLKHNYNYEDFETGEAIKALNNINLQQLQNPKEIDRMVEERHLKFKETENSLNKIVSDDLTVFHDRDLIMNELISFRLPFKFLKIGGFLFGFIYDKNFKFINFKHLSDVLFHLRIFLESKDEYV